jgi:hypothetical protein
MVSAGELASHALSAAQIRSIGLSWGWSAPCVALGPAGEYLISDPAVGLIELVKNAYDADATEVTVELLNPKDSGSGSVVVTDNGCGMTLDDIESKWLSPAVDHKERGKQRGNAASVGGCPSVRREERPTDGVSG